MKIQILLLLLALSLALRIEKEEDEEIEMEEGENVQGVSSTEVFDAINDARANPKKYIPPLELQLKYFRGNNIVIPNQPIIATTG